MISDCISSSKIKISAKGRVSANGSFLLASYVSDILLVVSVDWSQIRPNFGRFIIAQKSPIKAKKVKKRSEK